MVKGSQKRPAATRAAAQVAAAQVADTQVADTRVTDAPPVGKPLAAAKATATVRAAVAAVIVRDGRLLCGKRHGARGHGLLAMPGGAVEPGETQAQALAREVAEETGLQATLKPYATAREELWLVSDPDPAGHFVTAFYEAAEVAAAQGAGRVAAFAGLEANRCPVWEWLRLGEIAARLPPEVVRIAQARAGLGPRPAPEGDPDGPPQPLPTHPLLVWLPLDRLLVFRDHLGLEL